MVAQRRCKSKFLFQWTYNLFLRVSVRLAKVTARESHQGLEINKSGAFYYHMLTGYLKSMKVADQSLENPVPGFGSRQADAPRFERNGDGGEDMAILKKSPTVALESVTFLSSWEGKVHFAKQLTL